MPKIGDFFRNFRDVSTHNTPKITFYCIFINKFPKNFEKSAQKFFAAPSAPKVWRNTPIFSARVWKIHPPPLGGHPPQKYLCSLTLFRASLFGVAQGARGGVLRTPLAKSAIFIVAAWFLYQNASTSYFQSIKIICRAIGALLGYF